MLKLVFMVTIVDRSESEEAITILEKCSVPMTWGRYGKGTATDAILNYLRHR